MLQQLFHYSLRMAHCLCLCGFRWIGSLTCLPHAPLVYSFHGSNADLWFVSPHNYFHHTPHRLNTTTVERRWRLKSGDMEKGALTGWQSKNGQFIKPRRLHQTLASSQMLFEIIIHAVLLFRLTIGLQDRSGIHPLLEDLWCLLGLFFLLSPFLLCPPPL